MLEGQTTEYRRLRRDAVQQVALYSLVFLLAVAGAIALLWRASDIWAATHGHGTPGTWTATGRDTGFPMVAARSDTTCRWKATLTHTTERERYRSGTAYALPGSAQWLALTLVALLPLALAAFTMRLVSQVVKQSRRSRRRLAA